MRLNILATNALEAINVLNMGPGYHKLLLFRWETGKQTSHHWMGVGGILVPGS